MICNTSLHAGPGSDQSESRFRTMKSHHRRRKKTDINAPPTSVYTHSYEKVKELQQEEIFIMPVQNARPFAAIKILLTPKTIF